MPALFGAKKSVLLHKPAIVNSWTPVELFASGEAGVFVDFLSSTKYQERNDAGTTAVNDTDVIGTVYDQSGNGWKFTTGADAARPTYVAATGTARFDGANDYLTCANVTLNSAQIASAGVGWLRSNVADTSQRVYETAANPNTATSFSFSDEGTTTDTIAGSNVSYSGGAAYSGGSSSADEVLAGQPAFILQAADMRSVANGGPATQAGQTLFWYLNGVSGPASPTGAAWADRNGTFGTASHYVAARAGTSLFGEFDMHFFFVIERELTTDEITSFNSWAEDRQGGW